MHLSSMYSQSPSNDAGFNNAEDLLFCSTVVKTRPFSFSYSNGKNNYRETAGVKRHGETHSPMKAFIYMQLCNEVTSIHAKHHMARQNLPLSHRETMKGKLPIRKGVE